MHVHVAIENQTFSIEYELVNFTSAGVCVSCTFLGPSALECVAVVHQQISQLSSSGLMNIEASYKFNRLGDTAYGCILGVNLEQFQIGIVGGTMKEQRVTENTEGIYIYNYKRHVTSRLMRMGP